MSITNNSTITIGRRRRIPVTLLDALNAVIGFAFGVEQSGQDYGSDNPYLYGYRTWDCALRDAAPGLSDADVLASAGLNSGIDAAVALRMLAVVDNDDSLPNLEANPDFWMLNPLGLGSDPGAGHPEHELWVLWRKFTKLTGVAGAMCSKVVAHRWPTKYPLYDSKIALVYHSDSTWKEICDDLQQDPDWWEELERRFEHYRTTHHASRGVALYRVRMLDVVAWGHGIGHWDHLATLGEGLLEELPDPNTW
jgi:hypothetical protein